MAVTEGRLLRFSWQADAGALAERLHVQAEDRDLFDRVLARARQAYAPRACR